MREFASVLVSLLHSSSLAIIVYFAPIIGPAILFFIFMWLILVAAIAVVINEHISQQK